QFVTPTGTRTIIFLVVLGAPGSQFAVALHLAFENALDAALETFLPGFAARAIDEVIACRGGGFAQEFHQSNHRVIIESDVAMILVARRIELRPAAGGILGFKNMIEAFEKCLFLLRFFGG